jgi:hypothetical protein
MFDTHDRWAVFYLRDDSRSIFAAMKKAGRRTRLFFLCATTCDLTISAAIEACSAVSTRSNGPVSPRGDLLSL